MQTFALATALLAALAAAATGAGPGAGKSLAERDNISGYNADMDVDHYKDCWNLWVTQLGITGIGTNQGESTFTCSNDSYSDILFWNDKYQGYLWDGSPVSATVNTKDQMFRDMEAKYEHADYIVSDGAFKRAVGYQTNN